MKQRAEAAEKQAHGSIGSIGIDCHLSVMSSDISAALVALIFYYFIICFIIFYHLKQ